MNVNATIDRGIKLKIPTLVALILGLFAFSIAALLESRLFIPHYIISTLIVVICFSTLALKTGLLSFQSLGFLIAFYPALAPAYAWNILRKPYFSLAAKDIQTLELANATCWMFALGAIYFLLFTCDSRRARSIPRKVKYLRYTPTLMLGLSALLSVYLIDPGPTILTNSYVEILNSRFEASPLVNLGVTAFGAIWIAMFVFGRHHKRTFIFISLLVFAWLVLHARRVEAMGMVVFLVIWYSSIVPRKLLLLLFVAVVGIQFLVEVVRTEGLVGIFFEGADLTFTRLNEARAALPGGASNVFLSGSHIINVSSWAEFSGGCCITLWDWFRAPIPNPVWTALGLQPIRTEHQVVFEALKLSYVGGMPLLGAAYLNGGYYLVAFVSAALAILMSTFQSHLRADALQRKRIGGAVAEYFFGVFILYMFRLFWYNPQTPIRALAYALLLYCVLILCLKSYRSTVFGGAPSTPKPLS